MNGSFDGQGRIVFDDAETADAWVGDLPDERAVGCPECGLVHWDAEALVCCDTGQGVPLIDNGHRWLQAPDHLVMDHLYRSGDVAENADPAYAAIQRAIG